MAGEKKGRSIEETESRTMLLRSLLACALAVTSSSAGNSNQGRAFGSALPRLLSCTSRAEQAVANAALRAAAQKLDAASVRAALPLANVNTKDADGETALMNVLKYGNAAHPRHDEIVTLLVNAGADAGADLRHAAARGDLFGVKALVKVRCPHTGGPEASGGRRKPLDVNEARWDAVTALHLAARSGHAGPCFDPACSEGVLQHLLASGAHSQVDGTDGNGWTALLLAAGGGYARAVKVLLDAGADVEKARGGKNALMMAAEKGFGPTVMLLLQRGGAAVDAADDEGFSAIMFAVSEGHVDVVRTLLSAGASTVVTDPSSGAQRNVSTLVRAAMNAEMAELLGRKALQEKAGSEILRLLDAEKKKPLKTAADDE